MISPVAKSPGFWAQAAARPGERAGAPECDELGVVPPAAAMDDLPVVVLVNEIRRWLNISPAPPFSDWLQTQHQTPQPATAKDASPARR